MEEQEQKEKVYPKYHNYSLYIFIVIFALSFFVGRAIFTDGYIYFDGSVWVYALVSIIIGYILSTIIYEVGKTIFGKIAGYRLVYTSLFFFKFTKQANGKIKFSFDGIENFGGKTLMAKKNDKYTKGSTSLYLLGGLIFSIITFSIGLILIFVLIKDSNYYFIRYCYYLILLIDLLILILNDVPFLGDMFNDGFSLRLCLFTEENLIAFHQNLYQEEALYTASHPLSLFEYNDYHNLLTLKGAFYNYYYYMNNNEMKKGEETINLLLEHKDYMLNDHIGVAYSIKYYFMLLRGEYDKVEKEFWELPKSIRKAANDYHNYECIKTCLLIASFIDLNYDLYDYLTTRYEKLADSFYPLQQEKEDQLINDSLNYIQTHKEEWFKNDNQ